MIMKIFEDCPKVTFDLQKLSLFIKSAKWTLTKKVSTLHTVVFSSVWLDMCIKIYWSYISTKGATNIL